MADGTTDEVGQREGPFRTFVGQTAFVPGDVPRFYANNTQLQITPWDVTFDFGQIVGRTEEGGFLVQNLARVAMSPQHAKAVAHLLTTHLATYESEFGTIPLPQLASPDAEDS